MAEIIIIGAGLTGLSAAYHLEKQGFFDYKIFEKNSRSGGLLQSVQHEGFTFDHTGHLLHISDPSFYSFLDSIASVANFNLVERKTAIFSHNVLSDYPFQINLHGLPLDVAVECIEGYVKRSTHLKNPTNFHNWVLKHFGAGFGKHFFFPYNSKILSYDLKKVHPSWTGRFVPSTSLQAILKGTLEKKPPAGIGYNSSFYYPKKGGIEFIIQQLQAQLKNTVQTQHNVVHIDTVKKIVYFHNGQKESYRHLITTMPLPHLLDSMSPSARTTFDTAAQKMLCNSVTNINLGFSVDTLSDMHWIYFPEKTFPLYRMGFWHNISPTSVPTGNTAIYGEFSYLPNKINKKMVEKQTDMAIKKTLSFLGLEEHHVVAQKILHLDHAYVIYDAWRNKNLNKLLAHLKEMGLHSIGRYGEWKYSSMQEAVLDGKKTAASLLSTHNQTYMQASKPRESGYSLT